MVAPTGIETVSRRPSQSEPVLSGDRWIQVDLLGQMTPTEGNGVSNV